MTKEKIVLFFISCFAACYLSIFVLYVDSAILFYF